jgi:peptidoglycan/xylan/chitin deacetylase (PgdA/CDA1 family)
MYLAVTIDTEEDNWGQYDLPSFTVENIGRIPQLQRLFAARGVRPTYLVTYPVATDRRAIDLLGRELAAGACEIGTHLHPWSTPPVDEVRNAANSYIHRLPVALQLAKLRTLHAAIQDNFAVTPTSFRSGRWGFNDDVARHLIRLGYRVDTSVLPTQDWSADGGPDYSRASLDPYVYRVEPSREQPGGTLLEVPATVDFVQGPRAVASAAYRLMRAVPPVGHKVLAALDRFKVLNRVCVCPELDELPEMIRLARALLDRGTTVINMFFHSPTLLEGCSPYARTPEEVGAFLKRLDGFLAFAASQGLRPVTMSELTVSNFGGHAVKTLSH